MIKLINLKFVIRPQSLKIYKIVCPMHKAYFTEIYDAIESRLIEINKLPYFT